tara:strand:- start:14633 stop:15910 length:1278 start_codon:yes stop_codon:yes gene_type:complete
MQCRLLFLAPFALALLLSCGKKKEENEEPAPPPVATSANGTAGSATQPTSSWYRIEIEAEAGNVPFMLEVHLPLQPSSIATVANGAERISRTMTCEGVKCVVDFSVFGSKLVLDFTKETEPVGEWSLSEYYPGNTLSVVGVAVKGSGSAYRYLRTEEPAVDVSGKWVLDIKGVGPGKAEFVQHEDGTVQGWIVPTNIGDVRYLDGRVSGDTVQLSTFDGQHAYNVQLEVAADGKTLEGVWHYHKFWHYEMTGWRGKEPTLGELHTIRLKPGLTKLSLSELDALKGRPVILDFYGTWCSTCMDLMPVLVDLYARYKDQGLVVYSIAFEPSDDAELVKKQVELFEDKYGITWESSTRDVDDLEVIFEQLENTEGFPMTFFVNRDGTLQGLHSGFVSPAAAEEHAKLLEKYEALTKQILASKVRARVP